MVSQLKNVYFIFQISTKIHTKKEEERIKTRNLKKIAYKMLQLA